MIPSRPFRSTIRYMFFFGFSVLTSGCSTPAYYEVREQFYSGHYRDAASSLRDYYEDSSEKDRLLYLMEAGVALHTAGDYETSNRVFLSADRMAESIKVSLSGQAASFVLSDNEENFRGESFERVMIKFYIALNYALMGDLERARVFLRKLDYDQKEMKINEAVYRQNLLARYLMGILSEHMENYNDARVMYNNIRNMDPQNRSIFGDYYVLAVREGDRRDMWNYRAGKDQVLAFDRNLNPVPYEKGMGELVVIHQAGRAAVKESRGRIDSRDPLAIALRGAVYADLATGGRGITGAAVLSGLSDAENPIPRYRQRDSKGAVEARVFLNGRDLGKAPVYQDYSSTAIHSFNDAYPDIVRKNAASLAAKMIAATVTARIAAEATKTGMHSMTRNMGLMGFVADVAVDAGAGYAAGAGAAALVEPDLRCWSLLPSNFQVMRIFLEPGSYRVEIQRPGKMIRNLEKAEIRVEDGSLQFVNIRSFTPLDEES